MDCAPPAKLVPMTGGRGTAMIPHTHHPRFFILLHFVNLSRFYISFLLFSGRIFRRGLLDPADCRCVAWSSMGYLSIKRTDRFIIVSYLIVTDLPPNLKLCHLISVNHIEITSVSQL